MFKKRHDWRRWSGPRTEVTAAVGLASTVLADWSGIPSSVKSRISYANQLTETSDDPMALDQIHPTDLHRIEWLWIDVEPNLDLWQQRRREYDRRRWDLIFAHDKADEVAALVEPQPFMYNTSVSFQILDAFATGIRVEVQGADRTNVEGLMTRLVQMLNRSASGPTNLSTRVGWPILSGTLATAIGVAIGWLIGLAIVRGFNLAPTNNLWEWQEIVIPTGAAIATGALLLAFHWALPSIELLDTGERSRFDRFRAWLLTGLGTIIAGLIATAIWAAFT